MYLSDETLAAYYCSRPLDAAQLYAIEFFYVFKSNLGVTRAETIEMRTSSKKKPSTKKKK